MTASATAPEWVAEQTKKLSLLAGLLNHSVVDSGIGDYSAWVESTVGAMERLFEVCSREENLPVPEGFDTTWRFACGVLGLLHQSHRRLRQLIVSRFGLSLLVPWVRKWLHVDQSQKNRLIESMRLVLLTKPDWSLPLPPDLEPVIWTVRIPPLAYLRAMANLFWSAIRHPFSETTVDLSTGRVLYRS